jgi:hypothetical protein
MKKQLLSLLLPLLSLTALAQKPEDAVKYASLITADGLKEKLTVLAGPEMEAFIEEHFKKIGLKPGNGDSYRQPFNVYQDMLTEKKLMVNGKTYQWDQDYYFPMSMVSNTNWNQGAVVFVGNGTIDSATKTNDFKGLDVKGKLVLIADVAANGTAMNAPAMNKISYVRNQGAE